MLGANAVLASDETDRVRRPFGPGAVQLGRAEEQIDVETRGVAARMKFGELRALCDRSVDDVLCVEKERRTDGQRRTCAALRLVGIGDRARSARPRVRDRAS